MEAGRVDGGLGLAGRLLRGGSGRGRGRGRDRGRAQRAGRHERAVGAVRVLGCGGVRQGRGRRVLPVDLGGQGLEPCPRRAVAVRGGRARCLASGLLRRRGGHRLAQLGDQGHQLRDVVGGVEHLQREADHVVVAQVVAIAHVDRALGQGGEDGLPVLADRLGLRTEACPAALALGERRHQRLVRPEVRLEPLGDRLGAVLAAAAGRPRHGVEDAVHDEGPDVVGIQSGVCRTEVAAVGDAVVADLLVAERAPGEVHVASGVGGRHVLEDARHGGGAGLAIGAVVGQVLRELLVPQGERVLVELRHLLARLAEAHGQVLALDAARAHPDDVEPLAHLRAEVLGEVADGLRGGATGSAGVGEEGADALGRVVGGATADREPGGAQRRVVVVEGHLEGGALQARAAAGPRDLGRGHGAQGRGRLGVVLGRPAYGAAGRDRGRDSGGGGGREAERAAGGGGCCPGR